MTDLIINEERSSKVEKGIKYILELFSRQPYIFPRKIFASRSINQKIAYSVSEVFDYYQNYNFIDCWINGYPYVPLADPNIEFRLLAPNLVNIDLDNSGRETDYLDKIVEQTIINIHSLFGYECNPVVLKTGHGYHIYLPMNNDIPLECVSYFRRICKRPSQLFLMFAVIILSNNKADPLLTSSFDKSLLRVPHTFNSKCFVEKIDPEIKMIRANRMDSLGFPNPYLLVNAFNHFMRAQINKTYWSRW